MALHQGAAAPKLTFVESPFTASQGRIVIGGDAPILSTSAFLR
jgi:hypothetical protein